MTVLRDISIAWTVFHSLFLSGLFCESRFGKKKTAVLIGSFIALEVVAVLTVLFLGDTALTGKLIFPLFVLPALGFFLYLTKARNAKFLFGFFLVRTFSLWVLAVSNLIDSALGLPYHIVMFLIRLVIFPVAGWIVVSFGRKVFQTLQRKVSTAWELFSILAFLFYGALMFIAVFPSAIQSRPGDFPSLFMFLFLIPVVYITIFYVLWNQEKVHDVTEQNHYLDAWVRIAEEKISASAESEKKVKILRHDMRHRILLLREYISSGNTAKANEYLDTVVKEIDSTIPARYCANETVNVILSHYIKKAQGEGIQTEVEMAVPEKVSLNEIDFAVVLSNALENAIHAVRACSDKRLIVKGFTEGERLYLEVKNPFVGRVEFDNALPRAKDANHGYGTRSMASVVQKYGGVFSFVVEDGLFVFRCAM